MAGPLIPLISMSIAALRALGTKAASRELTRRAKKGFTGDVVKKQTAPGNQSFFTDKMAIRKANVANDQARKTAAQRLKDKFNKDK